MDELERKIQSIFATAVRAGMQTGQMMGAYDEDIDALAAEQGAPAVPSAVRSVFALIGVQPGLYSLAAGAVGPGGLHASDKSLALELLSELPPQNAKITDPQGMLVISVYEGEAFSIIDGSDLSQPNPPVWDLCGNYKLEKRWDSVTAWFTVVTNDVIRILRA